MCSVKMILCAALIVFVEQGAASTSRSVHFRDGEDISPWIFCKPTNVLSPARTPLSRSREILASQGWEGECDSGRSSPCPSPLRSCSPSPLFEEYKQIGDVARPGAGVVLSEQDHSLIDAAVTMAAHHTPPLDTHYLERVRDFCQAQAPFPKEVERYTGDWQILEEQLREEGKEYLPLIAYGSLMDDLSSTEFSVRGDTVWAFGARRSFDFVHPCPETSPFGMPHKDREGEILRLCVKYTGSYADNFNGMLMQINLGEELEALRVREKGYDLVRVPAVRFGGNRRTTMHLEYAYVLALPVEGVPHGLSQEAHPNKLYGVVKEDISLSPHMAYLYGCMRGAKTLKDTRMAPPLTLFLNTTHVGDVKLGDWLKQKTAHTCSPRSSPRKHFRTLKAEATPPFQGEFSSKTQSVKGVEGA